MKAVYDFKIENLSDLYVASSMLREFVEADLVRGDTDISKALQKMLDMIGRQLQMLLDFQGGEYWTIAVYEARQDQAGYLLHHVAGQRADRQDENKDHRTWKSGHGAVGHSFQIGRELIIKDVHDKENYGWLHLPQETVKKGDEQKYRSFAAVPIKIAEQADPWGVLVVSSDHPARFPTDGEGRGDFETEPIRMLAGMIALLAANHYVRGKNVKAAPKQAIGGPPG